MDSIGGTCLICIPSALAQVLGRFCCAVASYVYFTGTVKAISINQER